MKRKRILKYSMMIFMICCSLGILRQLYLEDTLQIYQKALRFHIRAASNKETDQRFKGVVRDRVLRELYPGVKEVHSAAAMKNLIREKKDYLQEIIEGLEEAYYGDRKETISIYFTRERFPIKKYGNVVFPAGTYEALRIDIGKGKGRNWWCAFYPRLCFFAEDDRGQDLEAELDDCLGKKEKELLTGKRIKVRFFFWEWVLDRERRNYGFSYRKK